MNGNGRAARWNGQGNVSYGRQENMPPAGSAAAHGANGAVPLDAAAGNGTAKKKEKRRFVIPHNCIDTAAEPVW